MLSPPVRVVWIVPDAASASLKVNQEEEGGAYLLIRLPNESVKSPPLRREARKEVSDRLRILGLDGPLEIFFLAPREEFLIGGFALLTWLKKEWPGSRSILWVWPPLLESKRLHRAIKWFRHRAAEVKVVRADWRKEVRTEAS